MSRRNNGCKRNKSPILFMGHNNTYPVRWQSTEVQFHKPIMVHYHTSRRLIRHNSQFTSITYVQWVAIQINLSTNKVNIYHQHRIIISHIQIMKTVAAEYFNTNNHIRYVILKKKHENFISIYWGFLGGISAFRWKTTQLSCCSQTLKKKLGENAKFQCNIVPAITFRFGYFQFSSKSYQAENSSSHQNCQILTWASALQCFIEISYSSCLPKS